MSKLLAFDWDLREIRIVEAEVRGAHVGVSRAEVMPFDEGMNADDPEQVGKFLRRQLDQRSLDAEAAVGCIARRDVVLQQINLPAVPDGELAKMVHFQVTSDLPPIELESTYDFVHYPSDDGQGARVLVAVAPRDRIDRIQRAADAAGLSLRSIRLESFARTTARQVWAEPQQELPEHGTEILLAGGEHHVEAIALSHGALLGSQLIPLHEDNSDPVHLGKAAVSRLAVLLGSQTPPLSADIISMGAPNKSSWGQRLSSELEKPILTFDPFKQLDEVPAQSWDALAALAGALAQQAPGVAQAVDFLHPRRPAAPHPLWKYRWTAAASAAVLCFAAVGLSVYARLRELDDELRQWQSELRTATAELKELRSYRRQHAVLAGWLDQRALWLDEYQELLRLLPDSSELYLTHVTFVQGSSRGGRGSIRLEGYASSESAVAQIALRLAESGRYHVRPGGIVPASRSANYPWRFEAELAIVPHTKSSPSKTDRSRNVSLRK